MLEDRLVPSAVRDLAGFTANTLPANDDDSTAAVALGFDAGFFGTTYNSLYVNNNGHVTFDGPLWHYTPYELTGASIPIIAPFFSDVDTRGPGSGLVTYGQDSVDGRAAFGVNWVGVGYFPESDDLLNSFQLVLIDRSDVAAGAFDIEFNYEQVQWDTSAFGDTYARAGYAGGVELAGSGESGAFLDSSPTGLIYSSLNSAVLGRYVFEVRGAGGNQAPTAADDNYGVDEDGLLDVAVAQGVLSNDSDPDDDVLTAALVTDVEHGVLVLQNDGSFTYTPAADWFGTDSFTYQVSDGNGGTVTATVTITVNPVNDAPVLGFIEDLIFIDGQPVELQIEAFDPDGDPLFFTATNLPPGLMIDSVTGIISGTPQSTNPPEGNDEYQVTIRVSDGNEADEANPFFQVAHMRNWAVTITNPAGYTGVLPAGDNLTTFTFTITATGIPGANGNVWWELFEFDFDNDDELVEARPINMVIDQNGMGTATGTFHLWSTRDGYVRSVDDDSGEVNPDAIKLRILSGATGTELARSTAITPGPTGTANTPTGSTSGAENIQQITATITLPAGFNGDLDSKLLTPMRFNFTVTIVGTANSTVSNLRWSLIETDLIFPDPDDELVKEREFSVNIGANGVGTFTGHFFLWARHDREIAGSDEKSGEINPNAIYILIEESDGTDRAFSQSIIVRGV